MSLLPTIALHEVFATVRWTAAAHASALDDLERAFAAETVIHKSAEEVSSIIILKKVRTVLYQLLN
jgi:hypothetical protein